jgi:hypothetical protein
MPPEAAAPTGGASSADPTVPPPLCTATLRQRVVAAEYAVRGEIVRRANAIEAELKAAAAKAGSSGEHGSSAPGSTTGYPFSKVVYCNIGNPQILGQRPITYFRQVLSLCEYPEVRCGLAGWCVGVPRGACVHSVRLHAPRPPRATTQHALHAPPPDTPPLPPPPKTHPPTPPW